MKSFLFILSLLFTSILNAQTKVLPAEIQIKTATLAAPEELRDGAMVYGFNEQGEMIVLREGTNHLVCLADDPAQKGINVSCYSNKLEPFMARGRELAAQGTGEMEKRETRKREAEAGSLSLTDSPAMTTILTGSEENYNAATGELTDGHFRYVIYIPYATAESTGLPEKPFAPGMPWIMDPGTHRAHIMITPPKN
ncbi:hypothetical protein VS868_16075 [Salinimicrobium sp. 3283s]|uniref:hypothetical protein n=1 Tax=Salinimicrobium sp. 3283s TaxID=3114359 RepID=UPI0031E6BAD5